MTIESSHVESSIPGIPPRNIRVYLPPGYDPAAPLAYPVMYMHDGQNVFAPGTEFGCWYAEEVADTEIAAGRVPPFFIVAIDNNGESRSHEYIPPGDQYPNRKPGIADQYAEFLLSDVIPFVTTNYNVTDKRSETIIAGSSLGGVASLYIGFETDTFGVIGSMSTAICYAENFLNALPEKPGKPIRIYHDIGSNEPEDMTPFDYDTMPRKLNENLQQAGYLKPHDLKFIIDESGHHNEAAWNRRLPKMLMWMFQ